MMHDEELGEDGNDGNGREVVTHPRLKAFSYFVINLSMPILALLSALYSLLFYSFDFEGSTIFSDIVYACTLWYSWNKNKEVYDQNLHDQSEQYRKIQKICTNWQRIMDEIQRLQSQGFVTQVSPSLASIFNILPEEAEEAEEADGEDPFAGNLASINELLKKRKDKLEKT